MIKVNKVLIDKYVGLFMLRGKNIDLTNIVIVEDDIEIANLLNTLLVKENYKPKIYNSGEAFWDDLEFNDPDLIILDIQLPDVSGLDICRHLKHNDNYKKIPVIALTARNQNYDIIKGLEMGFDDYITKPFDNNVLIAKIKSVIRKEKYLKLKVDTIKIHDDFLLEKENQSIIIDNKKFALTTFEFKTLCLLVENKNKVISRNKIIDEIKGDEVDCSDRSVDKLINRLRKKMGCYSESIISIYGAGYCFKYEINKFAKC